MMDWDLKTPSWDFLEFDREPAPDIIGSGCVGEQRPSRGDCSVDLKLGGLGEGGLNTWKDPRSLTMSSSSSPLINSVKRPRVPNGIQIASCLVDGCTADLSKCRDYHRRHKVCEAHSKTPRVMVGGQEQRFCQQCSRFHNLIEFDEVKRSCRKRLDGHNRRRRKPQPDSLSISSASTLYSHHQGARLLPFAHPQVRPSTTVMNNSAWGAVVKTEEESVHHNSHLLPHYVERQSPVPGSFLGTYKREQHFPFLQGNNPLLGHPTASVCQPLLNTIASSQSGGSSRKMFSDGLTRVLDSDCALSLLSSPPPTQSSGINIMSHLVHPDSIPIAQPLVHYTNLGGYHSEGIEGTVLVSDASDSEIHCHGMYNVGSDGSSRNEVQHRLPFSWE